MSCTNSIVHVANSMDNLFEQIFELLNISYTLGSLYKVIKIPILTVLEHQHGSVSNESLIVAFIEGDASPYQNFFWYSTHES